MMDSIFFDLPCVFIYLDYLLIDSRDAAEHCRHLHEVLHRLQLNGLVINQDKCVFGQTRMEFLGHTVSAGGKVPLPTRVAAIQDFQLPPQYRA
jgi:hypothetical protein